MRRRNVATHAGRSLAARGQFLRAFGGQAIFVAMALFVLGIYLIEDQFADPGQAPTSELLFAAVLLATSGTLVYCLLHPARRPHPRTSSHSISISEWKPAGSMVEHRRRPVWRENLPSYHRYVDHTRIRL